MEFFKLDNGKVIDENNKSYGEIHNFLEKEFGLISEISSELTNYSDVYHSSSDKNKLNSLIENHLNIHFTKIMGDKEIAYEDLEKEVDKEISKFKKHSQEIEETIRNKTESIFKETKTGGDEMFKNLKEAKMFTAHLDALATEIQNLEDVSPEMRTHLAYRLDKLSDLIEESTMDKQANGMGHGAWEQDSDEDYMKTMGGTGALEHDKDESFMEEFAGADHMEVLKRKEPSAVRMSSESDRSEKLAEYVKKAMSRLK